MGATVTAERSVRLTPNTGISIALVATIVVVAVFAGRQLQRLDSIEGELQALRVEVREMRGILVRQP